MHLGFVCLSVRLLAASALSLSLVAPARGPAGGEPAAGQAQAARDASPQDRYEPELNVLPEQAHAEGARVPSPASRP